MGSQRAAVKIIAELPLRLAEARAGSWAFEAHVGSPTGCETYEPSPHLRNSGRFDRAPRGAKIQPVPHRASALGGGQSRAGLKV